ncbi:MAG: transposase [bacterium]|nr:transposase [bacterium]
MHTQKQKRAPYPSDLTLRQFQMLASRLTVRKKRTGRPRADLKEIIDGILYVLSTGCRWSDLPHDYGVSYVTCYRYFRHWVKQGTLRKVFIFLKEEAHRRNYLHWRNGYLDASVVKSKKGVRNTADTRENIVLMVSNGVL